MSMEKITYIGPYIKVRPKMYQEEHTRLGCENKCKQTYLSAQVFCQVCGNKLSPQSFTKTVDKVGEVVVEDFSDQLYLAERKEEYITLLANHKIGFTAERNLSNITTDLIADELKWFCERYKEIIEALNKPDVSVETHMLWGVIIYYG